MKIGCEIIRDLLFLYEEDGCSKESRKLVEEHLKGCKECRSYQKKMRFPEEIMAEELESDSKKEEKVIRNSFRKVRRRWIASLVAVLLVLPMIGVGKMAYNEHMGWGVCFSNLDEIIETRQLLKLMEKGDHEAASWMMRGDYEEAYASIIEALERSDSEGIKEPQLKSIDDRNAYTLNGETWRLSIEMEEYFNTDSHLDESELWKNAIYGGRWGLFIPEEIWDEVIDKDDISVYQIDGAEMLKLNDKRCLYPPIAEDELLYSREFYLMETAYGNYYVNGALAEYFIDGAVEDEGDIYVLSRMLPESISSVAIEQLNEESVVLSNSTEIVFGPVRDMTEDEFCELMRQKFVEQMNGYKETGASFKVRGFRDAVWCGNRWEIRFDIEETYANGSKQHYMLTVDSLEGRITQISSIGGPHPMIHEIYAINGAANVTYWRDPLETE